MKIIGIALSLALTSVTGLINNPSEVEAKKKKSKPKLKFKGQFKKKWNQTMMQSF